MRLIPLAILLIALPTLAADPPPAQLAAPWLDRAAAELPAVAAEDAAFKKPGTGLEMVLSEDSLAIALFECRPDPANRQRLLDLAHRLEQAKPADDTPLARFDRACRPAFLYAHAGAVEQARRFYPTIETTAGQVDGFAGLGAPSVLPLIRIIAGDLPDDSIRQMTLLDFSILLRSSADYGKTADVARLAAAALKKVDPPTPDNRIERQLLAGTLAASRQLDAARKLAAGMDASTSYGAETLADIARAAHAAGDSAGSAAALKDALAIATALTGDSKRNPAVREILRAAVDTEDPAICSTVAPALAPLLDDNVFHHSVTTCCLLARAFLISGHRTEFDQYVAAAIKRVGVSNSDRAVEDWITVAATYARARNPERVKFAVDQADAAARDSKPVQPYEWNPLIEAHAHAGDFDAALAVARARLPKPQDRTSLLYLIAHLQALAGQYAQAEQTARDIDHPFYRFSTLRRIVVERLRTRRTDGLLQWIATNPSPRQRATLYLAAAQQLLGLEGKGTTRLFAIPN